MRHNRKSREKREKDQDQRLDMLEKRVSATIREVEALKARTEATKERNGLRLTASGD